MSKEYNLYLHIFPHGKVYVGITRQSPEQRWANGKGYQKSKQPIMHNAICKYGWDKIQHIILHKNLDELTAKQLEIIYITEVFHSNNRQFGYNRTDGGDGILGYKHTEETLFKISKASKELWKDPKHKEKMSIIRSGENNPNYGKVLSKKHKQILSECAKQRVGNKNSFYGKHHSEETKRKVSEAKKAQNLIGSKNPQSKPVRCIELNKVFESASLAAQWVGASRSTITNACRHGADFLSQGYHWEYIDK